MGISDTALRKLLNKPQEDRFEMNDGHGLGVRISNTGAISFQIRYRWNGLPVRLKIGTYPGMSIKEARDENNRLKSELERGNNPADILRVERTRTKLADTYEKVFYEWYEKVCKRDNKGHVEVRRTFEIHVLPHFGETPFANLDLFDWVDRIEQLADTYTTIADRVLSQTKKLYRWSRKRGYVDVNPVAELTAAEDFGIVSGKTSRVLNDKELVWYFDALRHSRMSPKNKAFVVLLILFGCRNGELRTALKDHFDFENRLWTVPSESHKTGTKTRQPIIRKFPEKFVPYIEETMRLSGKSKYLFTNNNSNEQMSRSSPLPLPYNMMQWVRKNKRQELNGAEVEHWSLHDLRRTNRTRMTTLTSRDVAEAILGHTIRGVEGIYNRYDYQIEMEKAYEAWHQTLSEIVGDVWPWRISH